MEGQQACLHSTQTFVKLKRRLYGESASLFTLHTNLGTQREVAVFTGYNF